MRVVYYFQSGDPNLHAFADSPAGDKLPAQNGPWTLVRQVSPDEKWTYSASRAAVAAGVLENGFLLWDTPEEPTSSKPLIESDRVEGTAVYGLNGGHIGQIKRLLIEKVSGRVTYAVMIFGGFLGIGSHEHTIPWGKLDYDTRLSGYRTDITEEQLRDAPVVFGNAEVWPDPAHEKQLHDYWYTRPPSIEVP